MRDGFTILHDALPPALLDALRDRLADPATERRGGLRNALEITEVRAAVEALRPLAEQLAAKPNPRCVRGIVFDKTRAANWNVAWHQDRSIAVGQRDEAPGFGPWSIKNGVVHVEPPVALLERMITLRLHLDDCGVDNGPLRVIAGSHESGILSDERITALCEGNRQRREAVLACGAGDVIAMRPLLLHASSRATAPARRRVVHLEFSAETLPAPLAWRWSV